MLLLLIFHKFSQFFPQNHHPPSFSSLFPPHSSLFLPFLNFHA